MDTAESMGTAHAEEAGIAAPFTAQRWLGRCSKSSSDVRSDGNDVWLCCFGDGSALNARVPSTLFRLPKYFTTCWYQRSRHMLLVWRVW